MRQEHLLLMRKPASGPMLDIEMPCRLGSFQSERKTDQRPKANFRIDQVLTTDYFRAISLPGIDGLLRHTKRAFVKNAAIMGLNLTGIGQWTWFRRAISRIRPCLTRCMVLGVMDCPSPETSRILFQSLGELVVAASKMVRLST